MKFFYISSSSNCFQMQSIDWQNKMDTNQISAKYPKDYQLHILKLAFRFRSENFLTVTKVSLKIQSFNSPSIVLFGDHGYSLFCMFSM